MDELENDFARFYIKDGVLFFIYKKIDELNLEAAKRIVGDRIKIQKNADYPVICDIRLLGSADKSARDYLAKEGSAYVKAVALLVDSPALKLMANFYLTVNKPDVPTKMFTAMPQALEFINKFK